MSSIKSKTVWYNRKYQKPASSNFGCNFRGKYIFLHIVKSKGFRNFVWSPLCNLLNYFDAIGKINTPVSKKQNADDPGVKSNLNLVFQEWVRRKNRFWGGKRKRRSLRRISEGGEFWRLEWSLRSRCRILVKEFARILMMKIMKNRITGDINREY